MGDKTVSVRVRFEGGEAVKAGLQEVGREGARAIEQIGTISAQTGAKLQNAGYQVSDFFVQVAGGTAPSRALAQQLPQLLQGFGLIGVAASVLIAALPSLWSLFGSGATDAEALQKELDGVSKATDAYSKAAELAIEPIEALRKKYGDLAESVRDARLSQAELAQADASRAVNALLSGTQGAGGAIGASSSDIAQVVAIEKQYARIKALQESLTPEQAQLFDFSADLAELDRMAASLGDLRLSIQSMAGEYGVTTEQAAVLAVAMERVRDSSGQGAAEQVAAAQALRDYLVEVFGSVDAANQATGGLVDRLDLSVTSSADLLATTGQLAGSIGAGADEAARLAQNLASSLAYGKVANTGGVDAIARQGNLANRVDTVGVLASGAGGVRKPTSGSQGGGGGGGGGADKDQARAIALTESLRTSTEQYALALEEVNRLKAKGLITDETYSRQLDKLNAKLGETGDLGKKAASAIRGAFDGLFDDPAAALKDLAKQLAMMALYQGLAQGFPSIFGSGGVVPLGVPGFASGGMHRGGLRIVGENGPELEATGPSMIYPTSALRGLGGGGTSVVINNNSGAPTDAKQRRGPDGQTLIEVTVGQSIGAGRQDKSLQGRFGVRPQRTLR